MYKVLRAALKNKISWLRRNIGLSTKMEQDADALLLWSALRDLNVRLIGLNGSVFEQVKATHENLNLSGKLHLQYIASVTPLLCSHGEFTSLLEWTDVSCLYKLGKKRNAWTLSLALPPLVAKGDIDSAISVLNELATKKTDGWLNTECIRSALDYLRILESRGDVSPIDYEAFHDAFISLLDAFSSEWNSRIHDQELIRSMISLMANLKCYQKSHGDRIIDAVIRNYGLCSDFWHHDLIETEQFTEQKLLETYSHWQNIYAQLKNTGKGVLDKSVPLAESLCWFSENNNQEALYFLRELFANQLIDHEYKFSLNGKKVIDYLYPNDLSKTKSEDLNIIWPTYLCSSYDADNKLVRITSQEKTNKLLKSYILVVSVVRNEMVMLPHFLEHYRTIGVQSFIFIDNDSTDGTRGFLSAQADVILYKADGEYKHANYGVSWQQAVLGNHCLGKWVLLADADELLVYPDCEHQALAEFVEEIENDGYDALLTCMVDMYPYGNLKEADFKKDSPFEVCPWYDFSPLIEWRMGSGQFSNMDSYLSTLRHRLSPESPPNSFTSQKVAIIRYQPWMRFSAGLHYAANVEMSDKQVIFAHFKYHAGFKEKAQEEVLRGQHFNGAEDYKHYLEMIKEIEGRFGKEGISEKYLNCTTMLESCFTFKGVRN